MPKSDTKPVYLSLDAELIEWLDEQADRRSAFIAELLEAYRAHEEDIDRVVRREVYEELRTHADALERMADRTRRVIESDDGSAVQVDLVNSEPEEDETVSAAVKDPFDGLDEQLEQRVQGVDGRGD